MAKNNYLSNEKMLQDYGALFHNVGKNTELVSVLLEIGYNSDKLAEGKLLFDKAEESFLKNKKVTAEETNTIALYKKKLEEIDKAYRADRKKAKEIFKNEPNILKNLALTGRVEVAFAKFLQQVKDLYVNLDNDTNLQESLKILKITPERIKTQIEDIKIVEKSYADYIQKKGESQQATFDKNKDFTALDKWVKDLYRLAKLALEDKPQLLESLAKVVK
ncbi:MAG: hypothetical protein Q3983_04570 [Capnocytophaga sp.]|nr:hypothetical protein [Capnocytophaga sp.]